MAASSVKAVDFSNVKEGGGAFNRNRIPAGDYSATIVKVEDAVSKKDDTFQYLFSIKIAKYPTRTFPYYCKLTENQLWKLRNLLIAAGLTVPKKRVKVDPNKAVGKTIGVTIEDAEYEGKEQSEVAAVFPAAELQDGELVTDDDDFVDDEGDEDEAVDSDDEGDDEDEAPEGDEYDAMDRTALKAALKAQDASFVAKKSQTDDDLRALLRAAGGDEEEPEEDEEEPAPAPKKARAKKAKKAEPTDEDLEELDIDDL